jgi:hypothetical protein
MLCCACDFESRARWDSLFDGTDVTGLLVVVGSGKWKLQFYSCEVVGKSVLPGVSETSLVTQPGRTRNFQSEVRVAAPAADDHIMAGVHNYMPYGIMAGSFVKCGIF